MPQCSRLHAKSFLDFCIFIKFGIDNGVNKNPNNLITNKPIQEI